MYMMRNSNIICISYLIELPLMGKFRMADWAQFEQQLRFSGLLNLPAFQAFAPMI